jgi:Contractile injection system tape measure protein
MRHIIKKQVIELYIDTQLDGFQIQELVSRHYWNTIVPMLEKILDAFGDENEVISIDRLEIDLGLLKEKNIRKEDWTANFQTRLEEILSRLIHPALPGRQNLTQPKHNSVFRQWLFYMQHGYLPWNAGGITDGWWLEVLETLAVDFETVHVLRTRVLGDQPLLRRIVSVHPETFLRQLAEIFTAEKQVSLPDVINELVRLQQFLVVQQKKGVTGTEPELRRIIWMQALRNAAVIAENRLRIRLSEQLVAAVVVPNPPISKLPNTISARLPQIREQVNSIVEAIRIARQEEKKRIRKTVKPLQKKTGSPEKDIPDQVKNKLPAKDKLPGEIRPAALLKIREENLPAREPGISIIGNVDEEGIFVSNAGLVLLHPFLHSLFSRLNWVNNKKFIDGHSQQQALYMLHYLASGNRHGEEFELVVPKALCSFPLEEPVDPDIELTLAEIQEADDMLTAAIQQWEILKNASAAALREGFLQRKGKLSVKNGSLHLQVEHNSIDLLLDYLPWNLSMILLPWMKDILRVEWR